MAKKFVPKIEESAVAFVTHKENGGSIPTKKALEMTKGAPIMTEENAEAYIATHWQKLLDTFDVPADLHDKMFEDVIAFGKKRIASSGFPQCITAAISNAKELFNQNTTDEQPSAEESPITPANGNPEQPTSPAAPTASSEPSTPSVDTTPLSLPEDTKKPVEKKEKKKEKEDDNKRSRPKTPVLTKILCIVLGIILGFGACFAIINGRGTHTDALGRVYSDDVVVYSYNYFLLSDYGAKGTITVVRDKEKTVGHNVTMLMDHTIFADKDGTQWLKYTSTTPDVSVEIIAPIFPEGERSSKRDWDKNLAYRNECFGVVEVIWNGKDCVVALKNASKSYELTYMS